MLKRKHRLNDSNPQLRYLMMRIKRKLIILCLLFFLPLIVPAGSGAAVIVKDAATLMSGPGTGCGQITTYLNIETSFDGCPIVLKERIPRDYVDEYHFYISHSCKTLNVTSKIFLTNQGSPTWTYLTAVQAVPSSTNNLFCGIDGSCDPSWTNSSYCHLEPKSTCGQWAVADEVNGDTMTLTQTIDVETLHSYDSGSFNFQVNAGASIKWYICPPAECCTECCQEETNVIGRHAWVNPSFIFADLAEMDSSLLKGGPGDNPDTEFEG